MRATSCRSSRALQGGGGEPLTGHQEPSTCKYLLLHEKSPNPIELYLERKCVAVIFAPHIRTLMVAGYLGLPLHGRYSHSRPDPLATARCLEGRQPTRLGALSLEKHPDKTFIGRIERGFDFLGYHFSPAGPSVAKTAITNFIEKASRLHEQERSAVSAGLRLRCTSGDGSDGSGVE
jgi:hypothetical protein